ncbi:MAG: hypothetical protein H6840_11200 [Planctomycetes bacterium]|nr:hypothetical protein [Planctomycetota bacterium]
MPRPVPVGPKVQLLPQKVLTVEYSEEDWTDDATRLALKLLKIKGVDGARVGEKGLITLTMDGKTELDPKEVQKLVKEAGMKFKTLAEPEEKKQG